MATVTGLTAARMASIEAASIVDGAVILDNLILTKFNGVEIDAGSVRGIPGPVGPAGDVSKAQLDTKQSQPLQFQTVTRLVATLPIATINPTKQIVAQVGPFNLALNDLVFTSAESQFTNDQTYNVKLGMSVISVIDPAAVLGTVVQRAMAENITVNEHHKIVSRSNVEKIPGDRPGRYYSLLADAAASPALSGHIVTVDDMAGLIRLSVAIFRQI